MLVATSLAFRISAMGQINANPTLKIGNPAPQFKVQAWLRGQPITQFEKGKVYVVDFWATWCGGCIMSFPHIGGLAEKYKDRVSFSSVSVYEALDNVKKEPVEKVKEFLATPQGQNLKFSVCVDGASNTMWNGWIKPLRRVGVPTTYVIDQEGKIAWIDVNIDQLGWVLDQVLAKEWDRDKAAAIMQQRDAITESAFKLLGKRSGDASATLAAIDEFEKRFPDRQDAVAFAKVLAYLKASPDKLPDLMESMAANPISRYIELSDTAFLAMQRKDLLPRAYVAAAKLLDRCLRNEYIAPNTGGSPMAIYERMAVAYDMAGDHANARSAIQKALARAVEEKASQEQVKRLQEAFSKYKIRS